MNRAFIISGLLAVTGYCLGQADEQGRFIEPHVEPATWFVPNAGQWPTEVLYRSKLQGADLWLTNLGWRAEVLGPGWEGVAGHGAAIGNDLESWVWDVEFVGGSIDGAIEERHVAGHVESYYLGSDPAHWASGLKPTGQVRRHQVWPGVKWVMEGRRGGRDRVKYDWVVAPGADPSQIQERHTGTAPLLRDGSLVHFLGEEDARWGEIIQSPPFAYQLVGTRMVEVACRYLVEPDADGATVGYAVGAYDTTLPLVIDPEIVFSTYIGATADTWGFTACYGANGELVAGSGIRAAGFPTTAGAVATTYQGGEFDVGITVFSSDGTALEFSTYLGGDAIDYPHSVITDAAGDIYVMGTTSSSDFPTTAGAYQLDFAGGPYTDLAQQHFYGAFDSGADIFVTKLDNGGMIASTFVGGSDNDGLNYGGNTNYNYGDVCRGEIAIDQGGRPWVVTTTRSTNFPVSTDAVESVLQGTMDAAVFCLSNDLAAMEYGTYLGGSSIDAGFGIQFTQNGPANAYITGGTRSNDFVTTTGAVQPDYGGDTDAFLVRLDISGANYFIADATFIGSSSYDQAYFVQLDADDRPYINGQTAGTFAVIGDGVYSNANGSTFVTRLNADLSEIELQTRIGANLSGAVDISPTAFLVSDCQEIYLSGWGGAVNSSNSGFALQSTTNGMPTTFDAFQWTTDGDDFWLGVLEPDATDLSYGTFFGGQWAAEHVDGGTSRFDKDGTVYQAVCAGCGGSDDFPTTEGVWSNQNLSSNCNLGVFKFELGSLSANFEIDAPDEICPGEPIQFVNTSIGATNYNWDFGDLSLSDEENPEYIYGTTGEWEIMLIVSSAEGSDGCLEPDTAFTTIFIQEPPAPTIDTVEPICEGSSVTLQAWGSEDLIWWDDATLSDTDIPNPVATPITTTTYTAYDENVCGAATAEVVVQVLVMETDITQDQSMCVGDVVQLEATGGSEVTWSPTVGLGSPGNATTTAAPTETTTYTAFIVSAAGCEAEEEVTLYVVPAAPGGQTYPLETLCAGQGLFLNAGDGDSWLWSPAESLSNPLSQSPYALPSETTTYSVQIANVCGVGTDSVTVALVTPEAAAAGAGWMCRGESMSLSASDGESWYWSPAALTSDASAQYVTVFPVESQTFTVWVTDAFGCTASNTVDVGVWQPPYVDAGPDREVDWPGEVRLFGTVDADTLWWSPADQLSCSDCLTPTVLNAGENEWFVLRTVDENGCIGSDSCRVELFYPLYIPNAFTPNNDGTNDVFRVEGVEAKGYWLEIYNRWGDLIFRSEDPQEPWLGNDQQRGSAGRGGEYFVQDGVYLWRLRYELREGPRLIEGHVTLVR